MGIRRIIEMPGVSTAEGLTKMPSVLRQSVFPEGELECCLINHQRMVKVCVKKKAHTVPRFPNVLPSLRVLMYLFVLVYLARVLLVPYGYSQKNSRIQNFTKNGTVFKVIYGLAGPSII